MKYLSSTNIKNKTVLLRADLNVPMEDGKILDDFRIESVVRTIKKILAQDCKLIICSHLGRPKGTEAEFSLAPVAEKLADLLKLKFAQAESRMPAFASPHLVFFTGDIRKETNRKTIREADRKEIIFLENIRFYEEEEENNPTFAKHLSELADVYVNDAFAVDHHPSSSTVGVTKYLPGLAGLELEQEILQLGKILHNPRKPFVAMMAGIKITDKEKTIHNLAGHADTILLGGGLANMIFLSRGYEVGLSKVERESEKLAWQLDHSLKNKILLPVDVVVAQKSLEKSTIRCCHPSEVRKNELILDIGPKTILRFANVLKTANTIIWNGPLGLFEHKPFHHGTMSLARVIGARGKGKCFAVVGGGETVDAVREAGQADYIDHLSTGGGAMLEFLAGNKLPGMLALK